MLKNFGDFVELYNRKGYGILEHVLAVARLSYITAVKLGYPNMPIIAGALLHDIAKIEWPSTLFFKPSLTNDDWNIIQKHPERGCELVKKMWPRVSDKVLEIIYTHHERPQGRGYPRAIKTLPRATEIITAVDVYVASQEWRPYKMRPASHQEALQNISWAPGEIVGIIKEVHREGEITDIWQLEYSESRSKERRIYTSGSRKTM